MEIYNEQIRDLLALRLHVPGETISQRVNQ